MRRNVTGPALMLLAMALQLPAVAVAQDSSSFSVHWAYSAYFGTGWYEVPGDRDVYVLRMTPRWTWSEPSLDPDGQRRLGVYFRAPISVGLQNFDYDDLLGAVDVDNAAYLSVNPGIDIEIPINDIWSLRPYASVGYGQVLDTSDSAWSYWAGIKSRVTFQSGKLEWRLLNQAGFVGYSPKEGPDDAMWPIMTGLEFDYPVGGPTADGDQLLLHWRAAYTVFADDLEFQATPTVITKVEDQWEVGVAIARRDSRIPIWFLRFDMLGIGYRASSSGDLRGVTFLYRSMFDL